MREENPTKATSCVINDCSPSKEYLKPFNESFLTSLNNFSIKLSLPSTDRDVGSVCSDKLFT
jgi:hypothetical protein